MTDEIVPVQPPTVSPVPTIADLHAGVNKLITQAEVKTQTEAQAAAQKLQEDVVGLYDHVNAEATSVKDFVREEMEAFHLSVLSEIENIKAHKGWTVVIVLVTAILSEAALLGGMWVLKLWGV